MSTFSSSSSTRGSCRGDSGRRDSGRRDNGGAHPPPRCRLFLRPRHHPLTALAPVDTRTSRCGLAPSPAGGLVRLATGGGLQLAKVSLAPESGCVAFKSPKPHCFLADVNPGGVEPCASPGRAAALVSAAALPWSPGYCMRCSAAGLPSTFLLCGPQGRPGCPSPPPLHQPCGSPAPPWPWPSTGQTGTLSPPAAGGLFCVWVTGHLFFPRYCAALIMVLIT